MEESQAQGVNVSPSDIELEEGKQGGVVENPTLATGGAAQVTSSWTNQNWGSNTGVGFDFKYRADLSWGWYEMTDNRWICWHLFVSLLEVGVAISALVLLYGGSKDVFNSTRCTSHYGSWTVNVSGIHGTTKEGVDPSILSRDCGWAENGVVFSVAAIVSREKAPLPLSTPPERKLNL